MTGTETLTITHIEFITTKPETGGAEAPQTTQGEAREAMPNASLENPTQEIPVLQ